MITPRNLEIVQVASTEKQQDLLTLLRDISDVTALGSTTDGEHFVVFECPDPRLKVAIEKLFAVVDSLPGLNFNSPQSLQPGGGVA